MFFCESCKYWNNEKPTDEKGKCELISQLLRIIYICKYDYYCQLYEETNIEF